MRGNVVDTLKKVGLDPMRNGQLRDLISSLLEKDEYKIAWVKAFTEKKTDTIRLARKVLRDWLKKEKFI